MCASIVNYVPVISATAASVSAIFAAIALIFNGVQLRKNTANSKRQMYVDALKRYSDLRKMIVDDESLADIYEAGFDLKTITKKQRHYIYLLIAFCEGLFLTEQINAFKKIDGGNWENFIRHTFRTAAVAAIWQEETANPTSSDYAVAFIAYVRGLGVMSAP